MKNHPEVRKTALVLPGGGARGAFQVGVLKALAESLPPGSVNPFNVLSGTSAGAINSVVLASKARRFRTAIAELEQVWGHFRSDQVFRTDSWTMLKSSLHWLTAIVLGGYLVGVPRSLLDNSPLAELLSRNIRFPRIQVSIDKGYLQAVAVTAAGYGSARSVTFFQGRPELTSWTRVRRIGRATRLTVDHLMASAAVPFVFPPVQIGGEFYGDGSMRHRAPLSPAIHLGADRMLVVGVRDERPDAEPPVGGKPEPPTFAHLGGYMLDTLFMDGLYADLEALSRTNRILEQLGPNKLTGPVAALRPLAAVSTVATVSTAGGCRWQLRFPHPVERDATFTSEYEVGAERARARWPVVRPIGVPFAGIVRMPSDIPLPDLDPNWVPPDAREAGAQTS